VRGLTRSDYAVTNFSSPLDSSMSLAYINLKVCWLLAFKRMGSLTKW